MLKRSIRLKELPPNLKRFVSVPDRYYIDNPALQRGSAYYQEADKEGYLITGTYNDSKSKIFLMGGSTIENIFVKANCRINYVLENLLLKNNYNYSVLNTAISGGTLLHIFNVIINKVALYQGSTILLTIPSNDFHALGMSKSYWNGSKNYGNIVPVDGSEKRNNTIDINHRHQLSLLHAISEFCKSFDIGLIISGIIHNHINNEYLKINSSVKKWCKNNSVPYLELSELLVGKNELFYDKLHFNNIGAQYAGAQLFNLISPFLKKTYLNFSEISIIQNVELEDKVYWSDFIKVSDKSKVSLWIDIRVDKKILHNSMLYTVEYDRDVSTEETGLSKSKIGFFSYLKLQDEGVDCCQHLLIKIPSNVKKIKIGIRKWNKDARIHLNNVYVKHIMHS